MFKYFFISIMSLFLISNLVFADEAYVKALENKLFGTTYQNENYNKRVDRIEKEIYEKNYVGNSEERLEKIYKIYPREELLGNKSSDLSNNYIGKEYTEEYTDNLSTENGSLVEENNEYPIISALEEQTFYKSFPNENIYERLNRLEKKIYGNTKNDLSLNERVENLKSKLKISTSKKYFDSENILFPQNKNYKEYYEQNKLSSILNDLELASFSQSFSYDNDEDRLNRLEKFHFGAYQTNLSEKERLSKLTKIISKKYNSHNDLSRLERNAKWAEIIMNLLIIGLGFVI